MEPALATGRERVTETKRKREGGRRRRKRNNKKRRKESRGGGGPALPCSPSWKAWTEKQKRKMINRLILD